MRKYYVGLDVHKVTIAIAVLDAHGKLITRTVIETSTEAVRDFFRNLGGEIHLTLGDKTSGAEGNGGREQEAPGVSGVEPGSGTRTGADCADHPHSRNALALPKQAPLLALFGLGGGDQKHSRS